MGNAELIAEAQEVADSIEGWLNSMPPYDRNSSDRDFDRRTLTGLRAVADALEAAEWQYRELQATVKPTVKQLAAAQAVIAEARVFASTDAYRGDDGVVDGDEVLRILSQSPTDALQERDAAKWDEGYTRGFYDREMMPGEVRDASEGPSENPYATPAPSTPEPETSTTGVSNA